MALITLAGSGILSGHLSMPLRGPWTFDGKIDVATVPSGTVALVCESGLTLSGTIDSARSGVVLDSSHVWVTGGAGGLGKPVAGAYYQAQLRDPLQAILAASGETLSATVDTALLSTSLPRWSIASCTCSAALTSLCTYAGKVTGSAINWRTLADGTIWLGSETWPAVQMDATDSVAAVYPPISKWAVSVSVPVVGPGVAVTGPNGEAIGNVSSVEHWIDSGRRTGQIATWLYTSDDETGSAAGLFRRNVRAALGLSADPESLPRIDHLALYPARVDAQSADGSTVDVTPTNPAITPQMLVPLRVPLPGCKMLFSTGAIVRVGWDEGDPARMFAVPCFDQGASVSTLTLADGSAQYVALANLVKGELDKIAHAFSTFIAGSGGASFPNAYTSASAVASSKVKAV